MSNFTHHLIKEYRETGHHGLTVPFILSAICIRNKSVTIEPSPRYKGRFWIDFEGEEEERFATQVAVEMLKDDLSGKAWDKLDNQISSFVCGQIGVRVYGLNKTSYAKTLIWTDHHVNVKSEDFVEKYLPEDIALFKKGILSRREKKKKPEYYWAESLLKDDVDFILSRIASYDAMQQNNVQEKA